MKLTAPYLVASSNKYAEAAEFVFAQQGTNNYDSKRRSNALQQSGEGALRVAGRLILLSFFGSVVVVMVTNLLRAMAKRP